MNITNYNLKNPIQKVINIKSYNISLYNFILNKSVSVNVNVLEDDNQIINNFSFILEGDDYNNWGVDDNYITNLVESKIHNLYPITIINTTGPTGFICFTEVDTRYTGATSTINTSL